MGDGPGYFVQTSQEERLAVGDAWRPPRKVLAIEASHRGTRGATHQVCQALVKGMEAAGAEVESVVLADLEFYRCRGCFSCWGKTWGRCVQDDDFTALVQSIPSYDLMLWVMPLYVDGMPGLMKDLVDRMMVLNHPAIVPRGERCMHPSRHRAMPYLAVAAVCGFRSSNNFAPLRQHMEALALDQHTPLLAFLERPESLGLMLPAGREAMTRAARALDAAGRQIIDFGNVSQELAEAIAAPLLTRSQYLELGQNWWKGRS